MGEITEIIAGGAGGDGTPLASIWPAAYQDLKQLARSRLQRSGDGITVLDTTALVNESFLKMAAAGQTHLQVATRQQFFAYASRVMRSVVVDLARERLAAQRGSGERRLTLNTAVLELPGLDEPTDIHEALESLELLEPRLAMVVQMRYFGGLTEPEVAEALDISERTVRREWEKARALLRTMLDS